jgi:hypothetical protein
MDAKALAALLTGREYRHEITRAEMADAKAAGLVVAFGASDDLLEFRGAIDDEVGCYDGGTAIVDRKGVLPDFDDIDRDDKDEMREYFKREGGGAKVDAKWEGEPGYSWIITTSIPHETFEIEDDGEKYCRGIVFALADLPAPRAQPVMSTAASEIKTYTFDEFVQYGRDNGGNIVNGMPWSFSFHGHPVTHENDRCYLISHSAGQQRFTPDEVLAVDSDGSITALRADPVQL